MKKTTTTRDLSKIVTLNGKAVRELQPKPVLSDAKKEPPAEDKSAAKKV